MKFEDLIEDMMTIDGDDEIDCTFNDDHSTLIVELDDDSNAGYWAGYIKGLILASDDIDKEDGQYAFDDWNHKDNVLIFNFHIED